MTLRFICIVVFLFWMPFGFAVNLQTAAQESYPKYIDQGATLSGICFEIIEAIETVDPEIRFMGKGQFLPFKRIQEYLANGQLDIFFGLKKTSKREQSYTFLNIHLYELNYVLAVRKNDAIQVTTLDQLAEYKNNEILSVFGTAASQFLKQNGLEIYDYPRSPHQALEMLKLGRGRFVFYHDLGLHSLIRDKGLENEIRLLPTSFKRYSHDVALNKNVDPSVIEQVEQALSKLQKNGRLGDIRMKYGLSPVHHTK